MVVIFFVLTWWIINEFEKFNASIHLQAPIDTQCFNFQQTNESNNGYHSRK